MIDTIGRHLATEAFPATPDGYQHLLDWLYSHGELLTVGLGGTGAYGAGVARFLTANSGTVVGVDRPDRKARRDNGKPTCRRLRRRHRRPAKHPKVWGSASRGLSARAGERASGKQEPSCGRVRTTAQPARVRRRRHHWR
ncbi:hypothetical protein [Streptomyces cucumeris]|uniref:hypothetical protein n=1 Tax=Streptomyces cucumeris TaxID=2962890 RepID=UPI003D72C5C3